MSDQTRDDRAARAEVWVSCAAVVVTLLLPWSGDDHLDRDAFARSGWVSAIGLGVVAGTLLLVATGRAGGWLRAWTILGAFAGAIATLATTAKVHDAPVGAAHARALGPWLFVLALAVLAVAAGRLRPEDVEDAAGGNGVSRRAAAGAAAGALGLALAVAGLAAPWQRLEAPPLRDLADSGSTVWTGAELGSTLALRWVLIGTALAALIAAAWPRTRRTVAPLVLIGGGLAVAVLSLPAVTRPTLHGLNATFGAAPGALVTLLGGLLCAIGGGLAGASVFPGLGKRSALAGAAAVTVLVAGAPGPAQHADAGGGSATPAHILATSGEEPRFGLDALHFDVKTDDDNGGFADRPSVVATAAGTFFLTSIEAEDDDYVVLAQIVGGRALPVTVLPDNDDASLLGVDAKRALVLLRRNDTYSVVSLDVHLSTNRFPLDHEPVRPGRPTVLLSSDGDDGPGRIRARSLQVTPAPDGGMLMLDQIGRRAWRVTAATVNSGAVWQPVTVPYALAPGAGNAAYAISGDSAIVRVLADGDTRPVVGGASDERCTLSRDPLSSSLVSRTSRSAFALTVDAAGRLWFLLSDADRTNNSVYLLAGGVLRRVPGLDRASGVQAMPDGSLLVTRDQRGPRGLDVYRIPSTTAAAAGATELPAIGRGCVSDSKVRIATQHRPVRRLVVAGLPREDGIYLPFRRFVDAAGAQVYEGERTILLARPGATTRTLGRIPDDAYLDDLAADGLGGAWWVLRNRSDDTATLWHAPANGNGRTVRTIRRSGTERNPAIETVADVGTGALLWSWGGRPSLTEPDGTTRSSPLDEVNLLLRDGRGYSSSTPKVYSVARDGRADSLLGDGPDPLSLPSAVATKAAAHSVYGDGAAGVAPNGDLVLHQRGYVARIAPDGRITVLAGPDDGVPNLALDTIDIVIGDRLIMSDGDTRVWTVDIS